jgi:hypothetical protein
MVLVSTYLIVFILFLLGIFQFLLIYGVPLGNYAWGGQHRVLPIKLRVGSVTSIIIYIFICLIFTSKVGIISLFPQGSGLTTASWILTPYFFTGIPLNAISRSKKERYVMTPVVTLLAILALIITLN